MDSEPAADGALMLVETPKGKLLAFASRWIKDAIGNGRWCRWWEAFGDPLAGREFFGRYAPHTLSCPNRHTPEQIEGGDEA